MRRLLLIAAALLGFGGGALAETRGLVVGVDRYASMQGLRGSVNDAGDLAAALRAAGTADLTVLLDADATRARFDREWAALLERSAPGDLVFLTFSGHGIRVPEDGERTTPDGFQKGFILQPYHARTARDEILRDEDLYDRFAQATARGLKVFFVADACHAGAAVRGTDPRGAPGFRFQQFDTGSQPVVAVTDEPHVGRPPNPDVTVFSATDEQLTIQEVVVDDAYRGALSYAVARGLSAAAAEGGPVTAGALRTYVSPVIRVLSNNRQIPHFTVPDDALALVAAPDRPADDDDGFGPPPLVRLAVVGAAAPPLDGVELVAREAAELIWDAGAGQIVDRSGDVLASGVGPGGVQAAVDARRVLDALRVRLATQPAEAGTRLGGEDNPDAAQFFVRDQIVGITIRPNDYTHATLLDLTASGTVQFLWPVARLGDPAGGRLTEDLTFEAPVTGPFGADYVITILSRTPLDALHGELMALHNSTSPLAFYRALAAAAKGDVRIGINAMFSCETLRSNGQCDSMPALQP